MRHEIYKQVENEKGEIITILDRVEEIEDSVQIVEEQKPINVSNVDLNTLTEEQLIILAEKLKLILK